MLISIDSSYPHSKNNNLKLDTSQLHFESSIKWYLAWFHVCNGYSFDLPLAKGYLPLGISPYSTLLSSCIKYIRFHCKNKNANEKAETRLLVLLKDVKSPFELYQYFRTHKLQTFPNFVWVYFYPARFEWKLYCVLVKHTVISRLR